MSKICNRCQAEVEGWDMEYHEKFDKWRLLPHRKKDSDEWCIRPRGRIIPNISDSRVPTDPNYVSPNPCKACSYYGRKCYPNQEHGHYANW